MIKYLFCIGMIWRHPWLALMHVLDKRYETSAWYNQAGRAWMLDFTWAPKQ